jgi:hypothetical protein
LVKTEPGSYGNETPPQPTTCPAGVPALSHWVESIPISIGRVAFIIRMT